MLSVQAAVERRAMTVQNDQRKTYEAPKAEVLLDKRASQGK